MTTPAPKPCDLNSFCLLCATWYYNRDMEKCEKCGAPIFRWTTNYDMKFFRRRWSTLEGL